MEYIPDYIAVLHGEQKAHYAHPILEPILAESMGVCVYQEQVIQILADVAGYSPGEADLVRRGISKKSKKTLDEHREVFAEGSGGNFRPAWRPTIWDALMGFARYGFNRSHAADYAVIVAQTGDLKAHYPGRVHGRVADGGATQHGEDRHADRRVPADGHRGVAAQYQRQRR